MRVYPVVLLASAERQLAEIGTYIAERSSLTTALAFVDEVEAFCHGLGHAPHRGTVQPDGSRLVAYRRRVAVRFQVTDEQVEVAAIAYAGRNIGEHSP